MRRLRALKMVEAKAIQGKNNTELAEQFGVTVRTIERTLTWAEHANIFAEYEDRILSGLVPLAYDAVEAALREGNSKVALDILKGTRLLRTSERAASASQQAREDDLADYIAKKRDAASLNTVTIDVKPLEEGAHAEHERRLEITASISGTSPDTESPDPAGSDSFSDGDQCSEDPPPSHGETGDGETRGWPLLAPDARHPNAPADCTEIGGSLREDPLT